MAQQAAPLLPDDGLTLILNGDVPLVRTETMRRLIALCGKDQIALLTVDTGDDAGATWPVPGAAIAVIDGEGVTLTGDGQVLPAGSLTRRLVLAQPSDARWRATVDGRPLAPLALPDGRQAFTLGAESGVLRLQLTGGAEAWPWVQLGTLLVLIVLAAPRLRRRS